MKTPNTPYGRNAQAFGDAYQERMRSGESRRREMVLLLSCCSKVVAVVIQASAQLMAVVAMVCFGVAEFVMKLATSAEISLTEFEQQQRLKVPVQPLPVTSPPLTETPAKQPETAVSAPFESPTTRGGERVADRRKPAHLVKKDDATVEADGKEYTKADINRELNTYSKRCVNVDGSINQNSLDKVAYYNFILRFLETGHDSITNYER